MHHYRGFHRERLGMCCTRLEVGNRITHFISDLLVVNAAGGMLVACEHQVNVETWAFPLGAPAVAPCRSTEQGSTDAEAFFQPERGPR